MRPWHNASMILSMLLLALSLPLRAEENRGALNTALEGQASLLKGAEKRPLAAFERLEANDIVALEGRITLVFFLTGRQESWQGVGKVELGPGEGKGSNLAAPAVKILSSFLVGQIAKTPILRAQGRAGVTRLRAIATPEAIDKVEAAYRRLRMAISADDLAPETYRLSALFETKAYGALEITIKELETSRANPNKEAKLLANL